MAGADAKKNGQDAKTSAEKIEDQQPLATQIDERGPDDVMRDVAAAKTEPLAETLGIGKAHGLVDVEVARGRTVIHNGRNYGPKEHFLCTRDERNHLAFQGAIINDIAPDMAAVGRGPDYGHEKEKPEKPYVLRTT